MAADRYDDRAARSAWQRLLTRSSEPRRLPTAAAEELAQLSVALADATAERLLVRGIAAAHLRGWSPGEIEHAAAARAGPGGARLARAAIAAERAGVSDEPARDDWLRRWRSQEGVDRPGCYDAVAEVGRVLAGLPRLPVPEVAAAGMVRVRLESPSPDGKAVLLAVVAEAHGCRAVEIGGLGLGVVVGRPDDLAVVERLVGSLLAQADAVLASPVPAAVSRSGSAPDTARARSPAFAQAFHLGFAARVRERLAALAPDRQQPGPGPPGIAVVEGQAGAEVGAEAGEVDREVGRVFGERLHRRSVGGWGDPHGRALGRAVADRVTLTPPGPAGQDWPAERSSASTIR